MMQDIRETNRRTIEEYRANRDNPDSPFKNRPLLLLTTIGAKSGQRRTTPMMYVRDGNRLLVIASNVGAPQHPDWYRNLLANPNVTVEIGAETYDATATVLEGAERQRLWDSIVQRNPFFAEHQAKITRQIPVVALTRA
jgi:deazaflavin-dependent oxidoreductase (nitroreductase family)